MSELLHVVCPNCDTVNRIPASRVDQGPNCGKCHRPLFSGHPVELNRANFDRHISRSEIPVLVDFWAPWCGPCRAMAPAYQEAARKLEPRLRLAKLNTEAEPELGERFGIRSIPTLILFRGGHEINRQSGALNSSDLFRWIQAQM